MSTHPPPKRSTLFVGGPRHGGEIDDEPPAFVDIASGERYVRKPVSFTSANPITKRPDWTYEVNVLVHEPIASVRHACHTCQSIVDGAHGRQYAGHRIEELHPAQQVFAATQDAVLRQWFINNGTKRKADTVASNGGAPTRVGYVAQCQGCSDEPGSPMGPRSRVFYTLKARGEWAREHIEQTGHELEFSEVAT